ncbi:MAG: RluA family pseudouridine synthase [Planctomycetes bacterium]|nr:RluA family pseudouridine synthase [Planctomycetota bacterium]
MPKQRPPSLRDDSEGDDRIELGSGAIAPGPGGKVNAESVHNAIQSAMQAAQASSEADEDGEELRGGLSPDAERAIRTVRFVLSKDLHNRLDRYLCDRIDFLSRNQVQKLIDEGSVKVNGKLPKASTDLRKNDAVEVVVPLPPSKNIQPEDIPLEVLFEDQHIIVLNKQPDIIVHPARSHIKGTMLSALAFHFRNRSQFGGDLSTVGNEFARPGVVHRLDRHTSGCIVFAKTDEAHWKLGHSFEHRRVEKRYLAVVHGIVEPAQDAIDFPIGPHPSREKGYREKQVVRHDELGKPALTLYRVREWYGVRVGESPSSTVPELRTGWVPRTPTPLPPGLARLPVTENGLYSLVELDLKTGRTHQIRVHLSEHGFPIVGDDMYGGKPYARRGGENLIEHPALHAALLAFDHPITEKRMEFVAPLRSNIAALVADLRNKGVTQPDVPGARVDLATALSRLG